MGVGENTAWYLVDCRMRSVTSIFLLFLLVVGPTAAFWGDADSDGDGIKDSADDDDDNDGLLDSEDIDDDGDGIKDEDEDHDGDGSQTRTTLMMTVTVFLMARRMMMV